MLHRICRAALNDTAKGKRYASAGIHDGLLVEVLFQAAVLLEAGGREVPLVVLDTLVTAARAGLEGPLTDSCIQATRRARLGGHQPLPSPSRRGSALLQ